MRNKRLLCRMLLHQLAVALSFVVCTNAYAKIPNGYFFNAHRLDELAGPGSNTVFVTPDQLTMYFSNGDLDEGDWKLWTTARDAIDRPFKSPTMLTAPFNEDGYYSSWPWLSVDKLTMIYQKGEGGPFDLEGATSNWIVHRTSPESPWG